jgi:hypothetical protein
MVYARDTRARDVKFVRTLEANGLTLLAAAVARELLRRSDLPDDEVVAMAPGGRGHHPH